MPPDPHLDSPVWYVAYGSNLAAARLRCYLAGGTPPGALRAQPGARDPRPPTADRRVEVPGRVGFGGRSRKWDGGVASFDPTGPGTTIGRAWRLTVGQLADVLAQENERTPGEVVLTADLLRAGGPVLADARYGRLVALPPVDGEPATTVTTHVPPPTVSPGAAYVAMLAAGLAELGLDEAAAAAYLSAAGGAAEDR